MENGNRKLDLLIAAFGGAIVGAILVSVFLFAIGILVPSGVKIATDDHYIREWFGALSGWVAAAVTMCTIWLLWKQISIQRRESNLKLSFDYSQRFDAISHELDHINNFEVFEDNLIFYIEFQDIRNREAIDLVSCIESLQYLHSDNSAMLTAALGPDAAYKRWSFKNKTAKLLIEMEMAFTKEPRSFFANGEMDDEKEWIDFMGSVIHAANIHLKKWWKLEYPKNKDAKLIPTVKAKKIARASKKYRKALIKEAGILQDQIMELYEMTH